MPITRVGGCTTSQTAEPAFPLKHILASRYYSTFRLEFSLFFFLGNYLQVKLPAASKSSTSKLHKLMFCVSHNL